MVRRITDALSSCPVKLLAMGSKSAKSAKISDSLLRRQRAASRDFSFLFSEFLEQAKEKKNQKRVNVLKIDTIFGQEIQLLFQIDACHRAKLMITIIGGS